MLAAEGPAVIASEEPSDLVGLGVELCNFSRRRLRIYSSRVVSDRLLRRSSLKTNLLHLLFIRCIWGAVLRRCGTLHLDVDVVKIQKEQSKFQLMDVSLTVLPAFPLLCFGIKHDAVLANQ